MRNTLCSCVFVVKKMSDDNCTICFQPKHCPYALEECGHEFCTACIVKWFRNSRSCPLCRDSPPYEIRRVDALERAKSIVRRARSKTASKELKKSVEHLRKKNTDADLKRRACAQLEREHKDVLKKVRKARSVYWRARRNAIVARRELGYRNFPNDEPLIPVGVTTVVEESFFRL